MSTDATLARQASIITSKLLLHFKTTSSTSVSIIWMQIATFSHLGQAQDIRVVMSGMPSAIHESIGSSEAPQEHNTAN